MAVTSYIGAITSAVNRSKKGKKTNKVVIGTIHPIHTCTKEQHLKWLEDNKCQCCGAESGQHEGICDECLFS